MGLGFQVSGFGIWDASCSRFRVLDFGFRLCRWHRVLVFGFRVSGSVFPGLGFPVPGSVSRVLSSGVGKGNLRWACMPDSAFRLRETLLLSLSDLSDYNPENLCLSVSFFPRDLGFQKETADMLSARIQHPCSGSILVLRC